MTSRAIAAARASASAPLLIRASSAAECAALEQATRGLAPVRFCASASELVARLQTEAIAGVVLELGPGTRREVPTIVAALDGRPMPLLLRFTLRNSIGIRDALELHQRINVLRLSSREVDAPADDVTAILTPALPARPRLRILAQVEPLLSGPEMRIVAAAVIAGQRAISVPELAALCDLSVRTVEVRCREARILSPKALLGWILALHATWWISRWGWPPAKVAQRVGLASEAALMSRVARTAGLRIAGARHTLDFDELLDRFEDAMATRGGSSRSQSITA